LWTSKPTVTKIPNKVGPKYSEIYGGRLGNVVGAEVLMLGKRNI